MAKSSAGTKSCLVMPHQSLGTRATENATLSDPPFDPLIVT
jgi:hypothetical protein